MSQFRFSILFLSSLFFLASCARPVLVIQAKSDDLKLDVDAFVDNSDELEIAYDFWSTGGVPFISLLNQTTDTLYLDLASSDFNQRSNSVEFEEFLYPSYGFERGSSSSQSLEFTRLNGKEVLILAPREWASFYGPPCHNNKSVQRKEPFTFTYAYVSSAEAEPIKVSHRFTLAGIDRIKRKEISSFERQLAGPDLYLVDNDNDLQNTWLILDLLVAVLQVI